MDDIQEVTSYQRLGAQGDPAESSTLHSAVTKQDCDCILGQLHRPIIPLQGKGHFFSFTGAQLV